MWALVIILISSTPYPPKMAMTSSVLYFTDKLACETAEKALANDYHEAKWFAYADMRCVPTSTQKGGDPGENH